MWIRVLDDSIAFELTGLQLDFHGAVGYSYDVSHRC